MNYPLHPDNADELALMAEEVGAAAIRGHLSYPGEGGGWQVSNVDLNEWLDQFQDQEVVLIVGSVGEAAPALLTCGVCGFEYDVVGPCPHCTHMTARDARDLEEKLKRREETKRLFREIEQLLDDESPDQSG